MRHFIKYPSSKGSVTGSTVFAASGYPKTLPYKYVSEDLSDYDDNIQETYEDIWEAALSKWEADPRKVPESMWKYSEAVVTNEDGFLQVSWGDWDNYEEMSSLASCKEHVASQYRIFRWSKSSPKPNKWPTWCLDPNEILLTKCYTYDTVDNLRDKGWDDILEWFRKQYWIFDDERCSLSAGTPLVKVDENTYYEFYKTERFGDEIVLPFLKPEHGGQPFHYKTRAQWDISPY